jgi:hypothetical protein
MVLGALNVGEDHVVVTLLDEAHGDAADRCLDRHAGVHERERRAADRAHRGGAIRLERLGDEANRVREILERWDHRLERPLRERAVADVAALRAAHEAGLPHRIGREVVVVHVAALLLEGEVVDALPLLGRAERQEREDLRLPAGEERRAVGARGDSHLALDWPDLVGRAAVRAAFLDGDLLANEILVDGLGGLLDELPRQRVLYDRGIALDRRRADGERQLDGLDDPVEEQVTLCRLELLRVLLGLGQRAEVVLELLAHRGDHGFEPEPLEQQVEARAHLHLADDVLLGRVHRHRRGKLACDLFDGGGGLAKTLGADALADPVRVRLLDLGSHVRIEPLRLPGLPAQVLLGVAELLDLGVRNLERLEELLFGDLARARLDHRQALVGADDDEVKRRVLFEFGQGRVDDPFVVDEADPHGADGSHEGQRRDHQRRRGTVDAEDVVGGDQVRRKRRADDLHLVREALRPERPDRAVDHPRGENRLLRGAPLALEEAAGDLPGGIHPLLDVHGEREEIRALARLRAAHRRGEDHRVARAHDHGAVRLLGELPRLERDLVAADSSRDTRVAGYHRAHMCLLFPSRKAEAEV